jgi:hypothetical protein
VVPGVLKKAILARVAEDEGVEDGPSAHSAPLIL